MLEACKITYLPLLKELLKDLPEEQVLEEIEAENVSEEMAEWVEKKQNGE